MISFAWRRLDIFEKCTENENFQIFKFTVFTIFFSSKAWNLQKKPSEFYSLYSIQARIQEFSSGGVQPSEKVWKAKKKKKKKKKKNAKKGEGGLLQYLFCFSMVEIYFRHWNSFINNNFYKYDISWCFLQAKHIQGYCLSFVKCVILQGGLGGPPPEKIWFK